MKKKRKFVTVMGLRLPIVWLKGFPDDRNNKDGGQTLGEADLLNEKIYLHDGLPEVARDKLLLHEAVHQMLWVTGASQNIDPKIEEVLAQSFTRLYYELKRQKF